MRRDPMRLTWLGALLLGILVAAPAGFGQEGSGEKPEKPKTVKKKAPPATAPVGKTGEEPKETPEISKETPEAGAPTASSKATKTAKKPSIEEEYVRANLEKHLNPTKIEWLPDGRVKLSFDFSEKKEEHVGIFTPNISKMANSTFRWSLPGEYTYWGRSTTTDISTYYGALRVSQSGMAHLNAWFTDDIEAEMWFANGASTTNRQTIAVVFSSGSKSIGSNWGTMAATFQGGALKGGKGTVENAPSDTNVKIKLVIRNGTFEAYRDGKMRQSEKYSPKGYASGKLGFVWGGNLAGFIYKLDITARPDAKKMADLLRKSTRS